MTISTDTASASYTGNGVTQVFNVQFYFLVDTDLKVSQKSAATGAVSVLTLNSDYTVSGAGNQAGGSITMTVVPATGDLLFIERNVDAVQETAYPVNSPFPSASHERALDRLTMLVQQILSKLTFGLFRNPLTSSYDVGGNRLTDVADAVDAQDVPSLHQVQELVVEGAVAGLSGDAGSSLVGFKQSGTGAVSRTVQDKLRESLSIKDYGCKGDGTTDDTNALGKAIAAAGALGVTRLSVPAGTYIISSEFIITSPIKFIGEGNGFVANADWPATTGSTFKWNGVGTAMFTFQNCNFTGFGMEGITLDCNALALIGLQVADSVGGHFQNLGIRNYKTRGLWLNSTTTHPSNTNAWHSFNGLSLDSTESSVSEAIRLSGFVGRSNADHNSFVNTRVSYGGTANGIVLGGCDNNSFLMTYIYQQPGGTGHGVYCDTTEQTGFPVNNTFFHLEATGGWYQPSGTTQSPANIYGYMQDNGEQLPALNTNGSLALNCADVVYPLTVAKGTGWSGGAPTFTAYYTRTGRTVTVVISFTGASVVAASGATITGLPSNGAYGLGMAHGVNYGGAGGTIDGYVSGGTLTLSSGITTSSGAQVTVSYIV